MLVYAADGEADNQANNKASGASIRWVNTAE